MHKLITINTRVKGAAKMKIRARLVSGFEALPDAELVDSVTENSFELHQSAAVKLIEQVLVEHNKNKWQDRQTTGYRASLLGVAFATSKMPYQYVFSFLVEIDTKWAKQMADSGLSAVVDATRITHIEPPPKPEQADG